MTTQLTVVQAAANTPTPEPSSSAQTMTGYAAVFDSGLDWTRGVAEIKSGVEGHFLERIAPGAFADTIRNDRVAVLWNHGKDPQVGDKPMGKITSLVEDSKGLRYEVQLFDSPYVQQLVPALGAGVLGASFRFATLLEDYNPRPGRSAHNPQGIPERTLRAVRLFEFGPCTFPAYPGASAGLRTSTTMPRLHAVPNVTSTSTQEVRRDRGLFWLTPDPKEKKA